MPKPDGGPAFPYSALDPDEETRQLHGTIYADNVGMSLRDWFAGQVISQCQITVRKEHSEPDAEMVNAYAERFARTAYVIADAMIAEREKA